MHDWVAIREHDHPADAEWDAAYLREFGIDARVRDPGADEYQPDPTAPVQVLVAPTDTEHARQLLAANEKPDDPGPVEDEPDPPEHDEAPAGPPSDRARVIDRALAYAPFGCVFPPFIIASSWLLLSALDKPGRLGASGVFWLLFAVVTNVLAGLMWGVVILSALR